MTLGEICKNICSGGTPLKGNSEFYENGTIPWLRTQEVVFNEITKTECFITETAVKKTSAKWIPANCVIVAISGASAGRCAINKIPLTTNQHCLNMEINSNVAHYKYVFYCVQNQYNELLDKKEGARGDLNASRIKSLKIPVPSLAMQEKIANVLDNFDAVCNDLNIGLPAEIALRKKQYEYYRDRILSFDTNVNNSIHGGGNLQDEIKLLQYVFGYAMVRLGDIATQFRGEYITQKNSKKGEIPVILGGLEPAYYIDKPNHYGEIIVVSRSGASAGFVSQWNEPIFITDGFGFEAKKEITSHKFLYYSLKNRERNLNEMKRGAGVPHVSGEMLNDVVFPIPSITEQERIVAILDKFDALVNDLSQGIPAEIEARKKQYEYYRDKLLNFKSKVA